MHHNQYFCLVTEDNDDVNHVEVNKVQIEDSSEKDEESKSQPNHRPGEEKYKQNIYHSLFLVQPTVQPKDGKVKEAKAEQLKLRLRRYKGSKIKPRYGKRKPKKGKTNRGRTANHRYVKDDKNFIITCDIYLKITHHITYTDFSSLVVSVVKNIKQI